MAVGLVESTTEPPVQKPVPVEIIETEGWPVTVIVPFAEAEQLLLLVAITE